MRGHFIAKLICLCIACCAAGARAHELDVTSLRDLPVLDGGRIKPIDTLAREMVRLVTGKESFGEVVENADGSQRVLGAYDPLALVLFWAKRDPALQERALLYVPNLELRSKLGMTGTQKWLAPTTLRSHSAFWNELEEIEARVSAAEREQEIVKLSPVEQAMRDLKLRLAYFDSAGNLSLYAIVPEKGGSGRWAHLSRFLDGSIVDPAAAGVGSAWTRVVDAMGQHEQEKFDEEVLRLKREIISLAGPAYVDFDAMRREVAYHRLHPFRLAWIAYFVAVAALVMSLIVRGPATYGVALALFVVAIAVNVLGFVLRCRITGWAPVTNMYETVIWVALTAAVFSLVMEFTYRGKTIAVAGAVIGLVACVVADIMPASLGRQFTPLTAVLRSNLWLTVHVLTIVSSYAAFAVALVLGNVAILQFMRDSFASALPRTSGRKAAAQTVDFAYRAIQVGVLLIAAGTILGGLWADVSWGRFWGWDPKEVWALITLLVYLALLHGRYAGWIGPFGLAAGAVLCFTAVIMSWYGVNFVLGAGLHSYGFGSGGLQYVLPCVFLQWGYVAAGWIVYKRISTGNAVRASREESDPRDQARTVAVGD